MKFIVSSSQLNKGLQAISGVVPTSSTMPIIQNFLFTISGEQLVAVATDLETTISANVPLSKVEGEGSFAIPHKLIMDILKNLPELPLLFSIEEESWAIKITASDGEYNLVGFDGNEFPKYPVIEGALSITLKTDVLKKAITKTIFAVGNDEMRPAMSGVYLELTDESTTFVATDAHKLVRFRRMDLTSEVNSSFIIPKKPLMQVKNNLPEDNNTDLVINYNQTNIHFNLGNVNVVARLIEGRYPNYSAVIPNNNPNVLTIDRMSLLLAIKRVSIFANASTMQIRLKLTSDIISISAEDLEYSNFAHETLPCAYEGEEMEIGFNARFILEMLSNIESQDVRIDMSQPNRPGIIYPIVEEANEQEDILMLVMPVMLKNT
jgi:DNA polymerase-3 subunit beta